MHFRVTLKFCQVLKTVDSNGLPQVLQEFLYKQIGKYIDQRQNFKQFFL